MFFLFLHGIGPWYVLFFPLVLDSTCFLLSFAVSQKYRHVFSERVDSKFNGNSAIPPLDPGKSELPGSLQRFGEDITPLAGGKWKKWDVVWNPTRWDESHRWRTLRILGRRIWELSPPGWRKIHIFRSGDPPKKPLLLSFQAGRQHPKLDIAIIFLCFGFWFVKQRSSSLTCDSEGLSHEQSK